MASEPNSRPLGPSAPPSDSSRPAQSIEDLLADFPYLEREDVYAALANASAVFSGDAERGKGAENTPASG